jgi:tryptophanyl-tRNA synthetase
MKIFSGIQPSGEIHIGNYLGAMKNWVKLQAENECIFCIVDLHAITVDYDVSTMQERIINATKDALAIGVDPEKSILFRQSDIKQHVELAWLLNTITTMGELNRMTQYKEKTEKHEERVGLYDYPVLMAADILLYQTEGVPVGEDQVQHIELARELARRFNSKFGQTFVEPKPILAAAKRIMSLSGTGKMAKSSGSATYIALADSADIIRKKIASATTDDGRADEISTGTQNLFLLLEEFGGTDLANKYKKQREEKTIKYSEMKADLAQVIIDELEPIQARRAKITDEDVYKVWAEGANKIQPLASSNMMEIKRKMGLVV